MMRTAQIRALAFAALAACGDSPPSCADVADHVVALRTAADTRTGRATNDETVAERRRRALEHCEESKLSPDVLACVMSAKDRQGVHACEHGEDTAAAR